MKMSNRVIAVKPAGDFILEITFDDNQSFTLDFAPMLESESGWLFDSLKDPRVFQQVKVNALTLEWPTGLDICPDVLRLWCERGRVLTQEESDAFFLDYFHSKAAA